MRALSKPLSSPSRADKFPPPLMRFLRSNVGSRSRGRSRSSPLFYLRSKRNAARAIETTQEPSSPKVTCIGQVRARGSAPTRRRCWWLRKTVFRRNISRRFLHRRRNPLGWMFCKCGSFISRDCFRAYSGSKNRKSDDVEAVNKGHCSRNGSERDYVDEFENHEAGRVESKRGFLEFLSSSTPPKNALMLTRCRSAPYRSSSLAGRFWSENNGESDEVGAPINVEEEEEEEENSSSEMENSGEENKKIGGSGVHPLLLTRCKSGPARIGGRLNAEAILLSQTRLADDVAPQNS